MKGKVTKDILLRVGQGVMRIPRDKDEPTPQKPEPFSPSASTLPENKNDRPANKLGRS